MLDACIVAAALMRAYPPEDQHMARRHVLLFVLMALAALVASTSGYAQSRPDDAEIATRLKAGGHVIVIRHGATHQDQADTDPLNT